MGPLGWGHPLPAALARIPLQARGYGYRQGEAALTRRQVTPSAAGAGGREAAHPSSSDAGRFARKTLPGEALSVFKTVADTGVRWPYLRAGPAPEEQVEVLQLSVFLRPLKNCCGRSVGGCHISGRQIGRLFC